MHSSIFLTIISSTGSIDLELPAEISIKELLPKLVSLVVHNQQADSFQCSLWLSGMSRPLDNAWSLQEAGIVDGAVLLLRYNAHGYATGR